MKSNRKMRFLLVILSTLVISSCSSKNKSNNFTKIADANDIAYFIGFDKSGNLRGFDTGGKEIQPCIQQNTVSSYENTHPGSEPCRTQIVKKADKTIVIKDGRRIIADFDVTVRAVGHPGSNCLTTTGGGRQLERCRD